MDSTGIVICEKPFVTGRRVVRKGATFASDHPLVVGRESHFRSISDQVDFGTAARVEDAPIAATAPAPPEVASARPGEKRVLDKTKTQRPAPRKHT